MNLHVWDVYIGNGESLFMSAFLCRLGAVYMEGGRSGHNKDPRKRIILVQYGFCINQFACQKLYSSTRIVPAER